MAKAEYHITSATDLAPLLERVSKYYNSGGKGVFKVVITDTKPQRSNPQNKYYWGVIIKIALEYYANNVGDLIRDLMSAMKFKLTNDFIHELFKILFNKGKSTTSNKTDDQEEYHLKIREHFLHDFKVDIPEPKRHQLIQMKINKDDIFHDCAILAFAQAKKEGKQNDSEYVKQLAYTLFEQNNSR